LKVRIHPEKRATGQFQKVHQPGQLSPL
jgi:hypothetical protein